MLATDDDFRGVNADEQHLDDFTTGIGVDRKSTRTRVWSLAEFLLSIPQFRERNLSANFYQTPPTNFTALQCRKSLPAQDERSGAGIVGRRLAASKVGQENSQSVFELRSEARG